MFTIEQYNTLSAAIATGALSVQYADKTVKYRSLAEMRSLLNEMAEQLGLNEDANRRRLADFSRGL